MKQGLICGDGDWLAFMISCATEKTSVKVYDQNDVFVKEYKNKTAFKKDTKNYNSEFRIEDCKSLPKNYETNYKFLIQNNIKNFLKETNCSDYILALGGPTNFRDELPLPYPYKGNRADLIKPLALYEIRDYLSNNYNCIHSINEEADDLLSKHQFSSYRDRSLRNIALTLDKDNRSTPGYLYVPNSGRDPFFIEGLGFLKRIEKISESGKKSYKLYGEGRKWLMCQLLMGDKTDGYLPCDIYKIQNNITTKTPIMTELKTFNLLNELETDRECWKAVCDVYLAWYENTTEWTDWRDNIVKGSWLDILQMYVDCAHMRRWDNDKIDVRNVLTKLNLTSYLDKDIKSFEEQNKEKQIIVEI